ncbi:MAG: N-acetylmuramoyl-L-alanine amidase, partial [Candidatus Hydrogenedentes bacterium]|nr:N-acetylmuramoyl-L-alanine amidase [Candidatus Hydrogenedentota bacterium]
KGDALYSSVVVRFTDIRENADIHEALKVIQKRSAIKDLNRVEIGDAVRIPVDMLSDRYQPAQSEQRRTYEAVRQEAEKLAADPVKAASLEGVVIILVPGHGGRDHGAAHYASGLFEDEITYDIMCRIKVLLETQTKARVYATQEDPNQKYVPSKTRKFTHDTDEVLLTTPRYQNTDGKISANLRWYLANKIYREERKKGTDDRKVLFVSIHCDSLFNESLRGTMVYIPGAGYRRDREQPGGAVYASYQEVRAHPTVTTDSAARRRDEAVSLNFAKGFLRALSTNNPPLKVHDAGDPIRNVIRQSGGRAFVPAVLRNTMVPTKVLIETANLTNASDRERLSDPEWRQWFAEAFVTAVRNYYD